MTQFMEYNKDNIGAIVKALYKAGYRNNNRSVEFLTDKLSSFIQPEDTDTMTISIEVGYYSDIGWSRSGFYEGQSERSCNYEKVDFLELYGDKVTKPSKKKFVIAGLLTAGAGLLYYKLRG